jgi:hypothetical protein
MIGNVIARLAGHQLVDRHFAGTTSGAGERRMWRHLPRCARCRERYRARALIESLDAEGEARARARIGRLLFEGARAERAAQPARTRLALGLTGACAGAFVLLAVVVLGRSVVRRDGGDFQPRGSLQATANDPAPVGPALTLYRVAPGGVPERAGSVIRLGESLAFAYGNPAPGAGKAARFLMVFAHDRAGRVFWYWPAWTDPAAPPRALAIDTTAGGARVELGESVQQPLAPGELTVMGLFCGRQLDVLTVEAALPGGEDALRALGCLLWRESVEVAP